MLTSADIVLMLAQPILFPVPVQVQGFSADDVFSIDQIKSVETSMGVDGVLSGGFVFTEIGQNIILQADSLSNDLFDIIYQSQVAGLTTYPLFGQVTIPAISSKFAMVNGFLTGYTPAPAAKKTLQARSYMITWGRIAPSPT